MSDDLRKLAEAATPGPWEVSDVQGLDDTWPVTTTTPGIRVSLARVHIRRNAAYIAAVSPDVVLGLLDERDARRETAQNGGCKCDPPGSGEEWCVGTCIERARADAALARERTAYQRGYREGHREGLNDDGGAGAARERTLRAALERYGRHDTGCPWGEALAHRGLSCTCGFADALAAAPAPEERDEFWNALYPDPEEEQ